MYLLPTTVDGNWGDWSGWTDCSVTCGTGTRSRTRFCDDPPPSNGQQCQGLGTEEADCATAKCPGVAEEGALINNNNNNNNNSNSNNKVLYSAPPTAAAQSSLHSKPT